MGSMHVMVTKPICQIMPDRHQASCAAATKHNNVLVAVEVHKRFGSLLRRWPGSSSLAHHLYSEVDQPRPCHVYTEIFIRGDTLAVLLELVEANILRELQNANMIAVQETNFDLMRYPQVQERHLNFDRRLQRSEPNFFVLPEPRYLPWHSPWVAEFVQQHVPQLDGDAIVRKLAYRAGIVKITIDAYDFVWKEMVTLIFRLLRPAYHWEEATCFKAAYRAGYCIPVRSLPLLPETIAMVSPAPTVDKLCPECGIAILRGTPVPKQIEDAAREMSLSCVKVYGDVWLAATAEKEERAAAMEEYTNADDMSLGEPFTWSEAEESWTLMEEDSVVNESDSGESSSEEETWRAVLQSLWSGLVGRYRTTEEEE